MQFLKNTYNKFTTKAWSRWEPDAAWIAQSAKIEKGIKKYVAFMPDITIDVTADEVKAAATKAGNAIKGFEEPITAKVVDTASGAKQWLKGQVASW